MWPPRYEARRLFARLAAGWLLSLFFRPDGVDAVHVSVGRVLLQERCQESVLDQFEEIGFCPSRLVELEIFAEEVYAEEGGAIRRQCDSDSGIE